ncbi:holin-associated N-acetylmuramidase [Profundibacterium mesophilum]|uniref:Secretion activating protein General function prediction only n=1 Tax=Profundibacterium mesophilum KAUST100406-0324 TaxID=1037889 RepID=A0A921NU97_9RHOB|nr:holin-associated N-acetylmuramidase [Profundibacterium mesophilum]KAF0675678.1 putative secretion activating protein General function prediction only [Profundibacterium mesophilum KAUST100406-0324]
MSTIRKIAEGILSREGGFTDDPDDPGGATRFGVTLGTLRRLGRDLDGDGTVTRADLMRLEKHEAVDIFIAHYFEAPGLGALPEALHPTVFDMQVNAGANAIRILQRLLCEMGFTVAIDGRMGPRTAAASARAMAAAPRHLVDAYGIARRNYYYRLADRRPPLRKFARRRDGGKGGWILRAETFISRRFHLSAQEHGERVASWA